MNRIDDYLELKRRIVEWIRHYTSSNGIKALVVGVSGGIDSAVTSTLCAETGLPTYALGMPLHQKVDQEDLSDSHLQWLVENYENVVIRKCHLTPTFEVFKAAMDDMGDNEHALANTRSRLRMVTLYQVAGSVGGIVVGTGNKVEDYGIGFYTKYGDGGVDIAPIADLYKTEVRELGGYLKVIPSIIDAKPTDGLWEDDRTDEDQIGATYEQLEEAMHEGTGPAVDILYRLNKLNLHKMEPIPTFLL
tara:strand:- start:198 stop:938 length:741 start_codon:yes stop_codon:yes gene_type:complete